MTTPDITRRRTRSGFIASSKGSVALKIPRDLWTAVCVAAEEDRRTGGAELIVAVEDWLRRRREPDGLSERGA